MPGAWICLEKKWSFVPLGGETGFTGNAEAPLAAAGTIGAARIVPRENGQWAVLGRPGAALRVNGIAVTSGIQVVGDRDTIQIGSATVILITAVAPRIENYTGPKILCARCGRDLISGPAVQCPSCKRWCHQSPEKPCWLYSDECNFCRARTALQEQEWRPDEM